MPERLDEGAVAPRATTPILILRVPRATPVWVRFLGLLRQLGTHRRGEDALLCWGPDKCPEKTHKLPYRSKWYAAAQVYLVEEQVWRYTVVEVNEPLFMCLPKRSPRGQVWCLYRKPKSNLPKQVYGEYAETIPPGRLPEAFDVDLVLKRVYDTMELPEPQKNLLDDRLMGTDEAGPAPKGLAAKKTVGGALDAMAISDEQRAQLKELAGRIGAAPTDPPTEDRRASRPASPRPSSNGHTNGHTNGTGGGR